MRTGFTERIAACIRQHNMFGKEHRVLVALSGGADSMALACVLLELGYRVEAAHCNFGLRGEESDRDEAFVRAFCQRKNVRLHVQTCATCDYARMHHVSIEMAARDLRYAFFDEILDKCGLDYVAVAHHREDDTETVLLNLVRGTGVRGLCGIHYIHGRVVRPMLDVSRREIEEYLDSMQQDYVTDCTNLQDEVQRNKIRLNVMPELRTLNPQADENIHRCAGIMKDTLAIYDFAIAEIRKRVLRGNRICLTELERMPAPETVLYELLRDKGFNPAQVSDIYNRRTSGSGKVYESAGYRLLRDRNVLIFEEKGALKPVSVILPSEGVVQISASESLCLTLEPYVGAHQIARGKHVACFDSDKLIFPLTVRTPREGDRFVPFGMRGGKLVSDFLTGLKRNIFEKERQLLLCSGEQIAWVVGERTDERFRITECTHTLLRVEYRTSREEPDYSS